MLMLLSWMKSKKPRNSAKRMQIPMGLITLGIVSSFLSCKPPLPDGRPESFMQNGEPWAYGVVQLTQLEAPGVVVLERLKPDQTFDSGDRQKPGGIPYNLIGAVQASLTGDNGRRDLAYIDLHPTPGESRALAYAYSLEVRPRTGRSEILDIYAKLRRSGRTFYGDTEINLGQAIFRTGMHTAQVSLSDGIKLSLIAEGVYQGQWALHYPDIRMVSPPNFQGYCRGSVTQMPGQMPSQHPGQRASCRPMPSQVDLCSGSPLGDRCRPTPPRLRGPIQELGAISGFDIVGAEGDRIFSTRENAEDGRVTFTSKVLAATPETNAELCSKAFYALSRTEGDQINTACILKPAPATVVNGKLTCAVSVTFQNATTFLEKICNVTGLFVGSTEPLQTVQILKQ